MSVTGDTHSFPLAIIIVLCAESMFLQLSNLDFSRKPRVFSENLNLPITRAHEPRPLKLGVNSVIPSFMLYYH